MFCENCQHQVSDAASFCPACGHPQVPVSSPPPQPAPQQRYSAYAPPATNAPTVAAKTNGMAVASLVLGIVWVFGITSILALIFGILSKRQIETSNGAQTGRGLSIRGNCSGRCRHRWFNFLDRRRNRRRAHLRSERPGVLIEPNLSVIRMANRSIPQ